MEGKFEGNVKDRAQAKRESIFNLIQAYFLYLEFHGAVNLDQVHELCPVGYGRYEYMKRREEELSSEIKSFGE